MSKNGNGDKPRVPFAIHIIAGGTAGMAEAVSTTAASSLDSRANLLSSFSYAANLWTPSKFECSSRALVERLVYV